jgi:recombination protein RecA
MAKKATAAPTTAQDLLNKLVEKERSGVSTGLDDLLGDPRYSIPTGIGVLDVAMGGGFPTGRMVEVYGEESSGKSTLVTHAGVQCQKMGGLVVLVDHESGFNKSYAAELGLDIGSLLVVKTPALEATVEKLLVILKTQKENKREAWECKKCDKISFEGKECSECGNKRVTLCPEDHPSRCYPTLIIWDTIAAAPPQVELDGEKSIGAKARAIQSGCRRLRPALGEVDACLVFVNQEIAVIGDQYRKRTTPGGRAIRYYSTLRLELKAGAVLYEELPSDRKVGKYDKGVPIGMGCSITVIKNKVRRPRSHIALPIYFYKGYDDSESMLDMFIRGGVALKAGSWITMPVPLTQKIMEKVQGTGFTAGIEEDDKTTFLKFNGRKGYLEMIQAVPEVVPALRKHLKTVERYI